MRRCNAPLRVMRQGRGQTHQSALAPPCGYAHTLGNIGECAVPFCQPQADDRGNLLFQWSCRGLCSGILLRGAIHHIWRIDSGYNL